MKTKLCIRAVLLSVVVIGSGAAFSQSNGPVSRSQVKAELQQLEEAGYNPARSEDPEYPADIQAAEARVMLRKLAPRAVAGNSEGGMTRAPTLSTGHAP